LRAEAVEKALRVGGRNRFGLGLDGRGLVLHGLVGGGRRRLLGHRLLGRRLLGRPLLLALLLLPCLGLPFLRRDVGRRAVPVALLADARLLADPAAQVVELRAVDVADGRHLDLLDLRRMQRERPLDADAERLLADGERLARAGALALDDDALEDLEARARAFDDPEVDADAVAGFEPGTALAQLALLDRLDGVHHERGAPTGRLTMLADRYLNPILFGGQ